MNDFLIKRAINKAKMSICRYKISAIGFDRNGKYLGSACNTQRFMHFGGGNHAEINLIRKCRSKLKTIIICRVNNNGEFLPIDPCDTCKRIADKLDIKIISIRE